MQGQTVNILIAVVELPTITLSTDTVLKVNQFTGFHGLVVPGTLRNSLVVLVGLLEQQTGLRPRELMTDTSGGE